MFENPQISSDDLPTVDSVDWTGMDARFVRRKMTGSAITIVFLIAVIATIQIIAGVAAASNGASVVLGWLWILPVFVAIPAFTWPFVSVPRLGYAVRDKDIVYKSGVFWRTVTAIPFNRIQHVEKSSTPLDRRFKIATLQLYTAGGSGGDLKIHGLSANAAEKLRAFILKKVGSGIEHA